jgi:hypothetical protein
MPYGSGHAESFLTFSGGWKRLVWEKVYRQRADLAGRLPHAALFLVVLLRAANDLNLEGCRFSARAHARGSEWGTRSGGAETFRQGKVFKYSTRAIASSWLIL